MTMLEDPNEVNWRKRIYARRKDIEEREAKIVALKWQINEIHKEAERKMSAKFKTIMEIQFQIERKKQEQKYYAAELGKLQVERRIVVEVVQ